MRYWADLFRAVMAVPEPGSDWASDVDGLHAFVLLTTMVGTALVSAFTLVALARFRARPPFPRVPPRGPTVLVEGTLVGGTLALFLLWWVLGFRLWTRSADPPEDAFEVYVVAKQWMWKFVYPDGRSAIGELVVPAGRPVRLVLTSRDVIHSFYLPGLRLKRDVVPGQATLAWFEARPGTYPLRCAEFCGMDHSRMLGRVVALDADEWTAWLDASADRGAPLDTAHAADLAARGRAVAEEKGCLRCHTLDGTPHLGPTWRGLYGGTVPLQSGGTVVADEPYLTRSMMRPDAEVHAGFGPIMPSYRGQLDAEETAALLELIRSLREPPETAP